MAQNVKDGITLVDRSSTIASGGTAQEVMAPNGARSFFLFQNVSDADMWIDFGATAKADQPSIKLADGDALVLDAKVPLSAVSVYCASGSKAYTAKEG